MSELAAFQDAFVAALHNPPSPTEAAGLKVYRNTIFKAVIDALNANYPTVVRLVGEEAFAAAARAFLDAGHWPQTPSLAAFGADFPDFIVGFALAADLPYLADVARIDRLWTEAHLAEDAPILPPDALAALAPDALPLTRLALAPSTRLTWLGTPAATIWLAHRGDADIDLSALEWRPEGLLLARPHGGVEALPLTAADHAFLAACERGETLGEAAVAALTLDPHAELGTRIAAFLALGAFQDHRTWP
jgi:hypothetical protein